MAENKKFEIKQKLRITSIMGSRHFYLYSVEDEEKMLFVNMEEDNDDVTIIVEVNADNSYKLIYTEEKMFGILDSGEFEDIFNEDRFGKILFMFLKQVKNINPIMGSKVKESNEANKDYKMFRESIMKSFLEIR